MDSPLKLISVMSGCSSSDFNIEFSKYTKALDTSLMLVPIDNAFRIENFVRKVERITR